MGPMHERLYEIGPLLERLRNEYPSQTEAFLNFLKEGEGGAVLSLKEKELIKPALADDVCSAGGRPPSRTSRPAGDMGAPGQPTRAACRHSRAHV